MLNSTLKMILITFFAIASQLNSQTLNIPVKSMSPTDNNYVFTGVINRDVYFYGFNQVLKDQKITDLDQNGVADWSDGEMSINYHPTGVVSTDDEILRSDPNSKGLLQQLGFNTGNVAFSVEAVLKVDGPQTGRYDAAWGIVNNNKNGATGSMFLIGDNHIQLGDKIVSTPDNTKALNSFRYSYKPSGKSNKIGTIFIYRNSKLLGTFTNRIGEMSFEWFGDWSDGIDGGYTIHYISFTPGCYAPEQPIKLPEVYVSNITGTLRGCHDKPKLSITNLRKVKFFAKGRDSKEQSPSQGKVFMTVTLALKSGYSLSLADYKISPSTSSSSCIGIKRFGSPSFSKISKGTINKSKSKASYVLLFEVDPLQKKMEIVSNLGTTLKIASLQFELTTKN